MESRRFAWLLVGLLWFVALLNYVDRQVIFSVFPLIKADLQLNPTQLGLLSTVFLWVYGLLSPFAGYVADRFGRTRVILTSLIVWTLVTWATGHVHSFGQLLTARALMGISEACYLPAALALIAGYHGEKSRSLATGIHQSGLYVGMIAGGWAGGAMGQNFGWRSAFVILGLTGVVYFFVLLMALRNDKAPAAAATNSRTSFFGSMGELLRVPGFLTMACVFSALSIANWMVYTWLPMYLYERFSMTLASAGFTATFYIQVASLGGILTGGWMADRWGSRHPRGRLLIQAGGMLLAGPFLFLIGYASLFPVLVAALISFGIGRGFYECNTMPVLCQVVRPELRSTAYGIFNMVGCIAGGAAAGLAGGLKDAIGLSAIFQLAAGICLVSGIALYRLKLVQSQKEEVAA